MYSLSNQGELTQIGSHWTVVQPSRFREIMLRNTAYLPYLVHTINHHKKNIRMLQITNIPNKCSLYQPSHDDTRCRLLTLQIRVHCINHHTKNIHCRLLTLQIWVHYINHHTMLLTLQIRVHCINHHTMIHVVDY